MAASRRIIKIRSISAGKALEPPAWNYDDVIGEIWMLELGVYDAETGKIYVSDPSAGVTPQWGGSYDDR